GVGIGIASKSARAKSDGVDSKSARAKGDGVGLKSSKTDSVDSKSSRANFDVPRGRMDGRRAKKPSSGRRASVS
ncbi:MAG: hypothetical protein ACOY0T_26105, partial [Myxococcota bacterium]